MQPCKSGADKVVIADIIGNELDHARGKLGQYEGKIDYVEDNATAMTRPEGQADANIIFFLLHELPHPLKIKALSEAGRMLAPGGKLYLAEFHRPGGASVALAELDLFQGLRALWPGIVGHP